MTSLVFSPISATSNAAVAAHNNIQLAFVEFFQLGIPAIERACNERRKYYLDIWRNQDPDSIMNEIRGQTCDRGVTEADPAFVFYEPGIVTVTVYQHNPSLTVKCICYTSGIFPNALSTIDYNLVLIAPTDDLRLLTFHELLHACGETSNPANLPPGTAPRADGLIRTEFLGVKALNNLLAGLPVLP